MAVGEQEAETDGAAPVEKLEVSRQEGALSLPAAEVKPLAPMERAAMFGFAKHISKDAGGFWALYDMKGLWDDALDSSFLPIVEEMLGGEDSMDPLNQRLFDSVGTEVFMACGPGSALGADALGRLLRRLAFANTRLEVEMQMRGEEDDDSKIEALTRDVLGLFVEDPEMVEQIPSLSLLYGARIPNEEDRGRLEQWIRSRFEMIQMLQEKNEVVEFEKSGVSLFGYRIDLKGLEVMLESSDFDFRDEERKVIRELSKISLLAYYGVKDDVIIYGFVSDEATIPLVGSVEESVLAREEIRFVDSFVGKKVHGFSYFSKELLDVLVGAPLAPWAEGIRDGLTSIEGVEGGDDFAVLLDLLIEKELDFVKRLGIKPGGGLIVRDQGLHFHFYDGLDWGLFDYDRPHRLGNLGMKQALIEGHLVVDPDGWKKAVGLFDGLMGVMQEMGGVVSPTGIELAEVLSLDPDLMKAAEERWADALQFLRATETVASGLEGEIALIVDGKGEMPAFSGVPQGFVDEGRFLRASLISPIKEREKLSEGWKMMEEALRPAVAQVGEMMGVKIPMQRAITSERDGMINYSFPIPFTSDDFNPSVSVGEKWWGLTTSKKQSFDLLVSANQAASERRGAWFRVDLKGVRSYLRGWMDLMEKEMKQSSEDEGLGDVRPEQISDFKRLIEATEVLDSIEFEGKREGDWIRHSLSFRASKAGDSP